MMQLKRLGLDFHRKNIAKIQEVLTKRGWDATLLMNPYNIYYASGLAPRTEGWERPQLLLIPQAEEPILLVQSHVSLSPEFKKLISDDRVKIYSEWPMHTPSTQHETPEWVTPEPVFKWAAREIEKAGFRGKLIGVEDNYTATTACARESWFGQVCGYLDARIVKAGTLVMELRMVKEPEEIALMRKAGEYADLLNKNLNESEKVGLTEREITRKAMAKTMKVIEEEIPLGASVRGRCFRTINEPGQLYPNYGFPLPEHVTYRMKEGDYCSCNVGGEVFLYRCESESSGVIGKPTEKDWKWFNKCVDIQLRAREAVKPGATCSEIDKVAIDAQRAAGIMPIGWGIGHGVGLMGHEPPWIRYGNDRVLVPGMTFTLEPDSRVPGFGQFHRSDTVLVTEDGYESLTKYDGIHRLTFEDRYWRE